MKAARTIEEIKLEWQQHNREHGMSWNEVAELVNEVAATHQEGRECYVEANPTSELPKKVEDGLELSEVVFIITTSGLMDVSRYDFANKRWFSSKQPLWWLKKATLPQISEGDEFMEDMSKSINKLMKGGEG